MHERYKRFYVENPADGKPWGIAYVNFVVQIATHTAPVNPKPVFSCRIHLYCSLPSWLDPRIQGETHSSRIYSLRLFSFF